MWLPELLQLNDDDELTKCKVNLIMKRSIHLLLKLIPGFDDTFSHVIIDSHTHTHRIHYAHAAANLDSGCTKYTKVTCMHFVQLHLAHFTCA